MEQFKSFHDNNLVDFKFIYYWEWSHRLLGRLIGFVFFAVLPYFLLFSKTQASSTWLDIGLLSGRLLLAVLLSLVGWVVTVGALTQLSPNEMSNMGSVRASAGTENVTVGS